jgi:hypothetical protein
LKQKISLVHVSSYMLTPSLWLRQIHHSLWNCCITVMITGFMIVETLAICTIHLSKLLWVHALRHYGLSIRFEELLSPFHNESSLHHYNPNSLKLVRLTPHSKKHAYQGVPTLVYKTYAFKTYIFVPRCWRNLTARTLRTYNKAYVLYTLLGADDLHFRHQPSQNSNKKSHDILQEVQ